MYNHLSESKSLVEKLNRMLNKMDLHQSVPQIEIDLMKDYLRQLYDLTNQFIADAVPDLTDAQKEVIENKKEAEPVNAANESLHIVKEDSIPKKPALVFEQTEEIKVLTEEKQSDNNREHKGLLNEKLHTEKEMLADKIKIKATNDLRTVIDLNERFFFTKELFNGDGYAFDKAIRFLNGLTSMEDAKVYVERELSKNYNWQNKQDAMQKFISAIRLKFNGSL